MFKWQHHYFLLLCRHPKSGVCL